VFVSDIPDVTAILTTLKSIAMEDGVITKEEQKLISTIVVNFNAYSELMKVAVQDNIITQAESNELFEKRMSVMEHAYQTAREDHDISNDEAELLKQVCGVIIKMSKK
jgi:hypothetical protein